MIRWSATYFIILCSDDWPAVGIIWHTLSFKYYEI